MSARDEATASDPVVRAASTNFLAYLFAHGAWFLAFGVQMVIFPYLVRVVLQEDAVRFGLAQMCLQLPTTLLILIGGFVADRADGRRIVVAACAVAAATFLGLGLAVTLGRLSYGLMIAYALTVGVIGAFATPARDSLLSHMAPEDGGVQRAVSAAFLAQFAGQIVGMVFAMATPILGVRALLFGQAVLLGVAGVAALRMRPRPSGARPPSEGHALAFLARQIGGGFQAVVASPVIGPVLLLSIGMGVCFFGAFSVLLPLIVQGYFPDQADGRANPAIAAALGAFTLCFWVGSMLSAMALMRLGPPRRKGLAYLVALGSGAFILLLCALPMPLWTLCALNLFWGMGGGVAMTLGRGLVQEHAPPDRRARVLSIFTLGGMGGAPIGSVVYGVLAHAAGPRAAILVPALLMGAVVAGVWTRTRLAALA